MSTFLIGLVVVAATVFVIRVALSDPDQPATIRRPTNRDRPRRARPHPAQRLAARPERALPPDAPLAGDAPLTVPLRPRTPPQKRPVRRTAQQKRPVRRTAQQKRPVRRTAQRKRPAPRRRPPQPRREPAQAWVRLRSGLALVVLVTFVGVVIAVATGTGLALAARALRHAVG